MNLFPILTESQEVILRDNKTNINYIVIEDQFVDMEFGAVDNLVMIAVLLISLGLSLSKTLSYQSDADSSEEESSSKASKAPSRTTSTLRIIAAAGSTTSPFVNSLCLFGLTGEVFEHTGSVIFFLLGVVLSVLLLFLTDFFSIMAKNRLTAFPTYLKRRFGRRGLSHIVALSSILRHFMGGVLNLCVMGIGVSTMMGLSPFFTSLVIAVAAVACSSASKIHSGSNSSIGGTLIWLVGLTSLVTLTVTTAEEGGFGALFAKAVDLGKLQMPTLSLVPWSRDSLWGYLSIGMILGFQMFAFSRSTLRHCNTLSRKAFYGSVFVTLVLILLWTSIGFWAGICVSVEFAGTAVALPDGLLAKLVSKQMEDMRGFRGFFVSTLFAASISGLTRRYNQLTQLLWEVFHSLCTPDEERGNALTKFVQRNPKVIPDDYLKELRWEERKKSCFRHFFFKFGLSLMIATLSCALVFMFLNLNTTLWELWQSVIGIFIGPMVAALLIGLFCPCISHMSVCLGLMIGWAIPCYLMIGNKMSNFEDVTAFSTVSPFAVKFDHLATPIVDSTTFGYLNITQKESVFVVIHNNEVVEEFQENGKAFIEIPNKADYEAELQNKRRRSLTRRKCKSHLDPSAALLLNTQMRRKFFPKVRTRKEVEEDEGEEKEATLRRPSQVVLKQKRNALNFLQETANI